LIFLKKIKNFIKFKIIYSGPYKQWSDAKIRSTGYNNKLILKKVSETTLKVLRGKYLYERDSVGFNDYTVDKFFLKSLNYINSHNKNKLSILDFGGSLGSKYFQHKKFFKKIKNFYWSIVEQKKYVEFGKKFINESNLFFFDKLNICLIKKNPNVCLISNSIQYTERPFHNLNAITKAQIKFIIFLNLPLTDQDKDEIFVQKVSKSIYNASYPIWFFSKKKFFDFIKNKKFSLFKSEISRETKYETFKYYNFLFTK
jgi:putative methyltransferase (TIGR04325 family)